MCLGIVSAFTPAGGNYEGPHDCDVDLHDILPAIAQAKVGGWVLPFANPRHAHEYRCLKDLPLGDGQVVVAGVIDPLTNFVEHPEVVADRLERVVQVVGDPTRVLAGTDCGFDTSAGRGRVAEDVVWAKLRAMYLTARGLRRSGWGCRGSSVYPPGVGPTGSPICVRVSIIAAAQGGLLLVSGRLDDTRLR